ncbi:glycosyltransferase family 4 protein [Dysgonomonas sp. Marseille-P4677]|uniref:glycosyltransferase family 4 protein n=1 Tax=Dysgonomonas sp. Marseille-P4677 TaxID=2364790 RepID=UPI001912F478|nr:glycosyltransferase family 4 protein [Dysgonomonas sp. Marseille-P4677]MBK5721227.1 glycosyltransferase family 4 protein [Dysgonomonas sp. Marseille-P4677]
MNNIGQVKLKINMVLPYFGSRAGGGLKVMYEYAKRLSARGHDITIYSSVRTNYRQEYNKSDFTLKRKCLIKSIKGRQRPKWFSLPKDIICKIIPYVSDTYIRNADVCISTWWAIAYHISGLSLSKGVKFNLIQAYETIMTSESENDVHDSYKLPINHIVISSYLEKIVSCYAKNGRISYIPNAIDLDIYKLIIPIENRIPQTLILRYSSSKYKACKYAIEAFIHLKEKYADLDVILFSSEKKPDNLPRWMKYIYGSSDTVPLYNKSAIYVSSSITEGWPLPPMEAMACGCACVCTNIPSHLSYMIDGENALLVEPESVDDLITRISYLIDNSHKRIELAKHSNLLIKQYDWECSVDKLESLFYKSLNK